MRGGKNSCLRFSPHAERRGERSKGGEEDEQESDETAGTALVERKILERGA